LEGRWGWLEVLRQARWNDVLKFDDGTVGRFSARATDIWLDRPDNDLSELTSAAKVGQEFDHYRLEKHVPETGERTGEIFETDAWTRYDRVRVDLNKVDLLSLAFDGIGVCTGGLGDDLAKGIGKRTMKALDVTQNVGGTAYGVGVVANKVASGEAGVVDAAAGVTDIVSLFGGPMWNVLGIILNFGGTVSYGP
jgi:hypothetical protein